MKRLSQSKNNVQLWMWLVMEVKSNAVKNNAVKRSCKGTWNVRSMNQGKLEVVKQQRRSNQSILKISPGCSLEGLMLKLKLQYFGHLMQKADSLKRPWCWERLKAGGEGDDRGWDGWMASPTQWTWVWVDSRSWWWTRRPGVLRFMGSQRLRHDWVTELNWIETGNGKSEHRRFRNQWTKMDLNGWI